MLEGLTDLGELPNKLKENADNVDYKDLHRKLKERLKTQLGPRIVGLLDEIKDLEAKFSGMKVPRESDDFVVAVEKYQESVQRLVAKVKTVESDETPAVPVAATDTKDERLKLLAEAEVAARKAEADEAKKKQGKKKAADPVAADAEPEPAEFEPPKPFEASELFKDYPKLEEGILGILDTGTLPPGAKKDELRSYVGGINEKINAAPSEVKDIYHFVLDALDCLDIKDDPREVWAEQQGLAKSILNKRRRAQSSGHPAIKRCRKWLGNFINADFRSPLCMEMAEHNVVGYRGGRLEFDTKKTPELEPVQDRIINYLAAAYRRQDIIKGHNGKFDVRPATARVNGDLQYERSVPPEEVGAVLFNIDNAVDGRPNENESPNMVGITREQIKEVLPGWLEALPVDKIRYVTGKPFTMKFADGVEHQVKLPTNNDELLIGKKCAVVSADGGKIKIGDEEVDKKFFTITKFTEESPGNFVVTLENEIGGSSECKISLPAGKPSARGGARSDRGPSSDLSDAERTAEFMKPGQFYHIRVEGKLMDCEVVSVDQTTGQVVVRDYITLEKFPPLEIADWQDREKLVGPYPESVLVEDYDTPKLQRQLGTRAKNLAELAGVHRGGKGKSRGAGEEADDYQEPVPGSRLFDQFVGSTGPKGKRKTITFSEKLYDVLKGDLKPGQRIGRIITFLKENALGFKSYFEKDDTAKQAKDFIIDGLRCFDLIGQPEIVWAAYQADAKNVLKSRSDVVNLDDPYVKMVRGWLEDFLKCDYGSPESIKFARSGIIGINGESLSIPEVETKTAPEAIKDYLSILHRRLDVIRLNTGQLDVRPALYRGADDIKYQRNVPPDDVGKILFPGEKLPDSLANQGVTFDQIQATLPEWLDTLPVDKINIPRGKGFGIELKNYGAYRVELTSGEIMTRSKCTLRLLKDATIHLSGDEQTQIHPRIASIEAIPGDSDKFTVTFMERVGVDAGCTVSLGSRDNGRTPVPETPESRERKKNIIDLWCNSIILPRLRRHENDGRTIYYVTFRPKAEGGGQLEEDFDIEPYIEYNLPNQLPGQPGELSYDEFTDRIRSWYEEVKNDPSKIPTQAEYLATVEAIARERIPYREALAKKLTPEKRGLAFGWLNENILPGIYQEDGVVKRATEREIAEKKINPDKKTFDSHGFAYWLENQEKLDKIPGGIDKDEIAAVVAEWFDSLDKSVFPDKPPFELGGVPTVDPAEVERIRLEKETTKKERISDWCTDNLKPLIFKKADGKVYHRKKTDQEFDIDTFIENKKRRGIPATFENKDLNLSFDDFAAAVRDWYSSNQDKISADEIAGHVEPKPPRVYSPVGEYNHADQTLTLPGLLFEEKLDLRIADWDCDVTNEPDPSVVGDGKLFISYAGGLAELDLLYHQDGTVTNAKMKTNKGESIGDFNSIKEAVLAFKSKIEHEGEHQDEDEDNTSAEKVDPPFALHVPAPWDSGFSASGPHIEPAVQVVEEEKPTPEVKKNHPNLIEELNQTGHKLKLADGREIDLAISKPGIIGPYYDTGLRDTNFPEDVAWQIIYDGMGASIVNPRFTIWFNEKTGDITNLSFVGFKKVTKDFAPGDSVDVADFFQKFVESIPDAAPKPLFEGFDVTTGILKFNGDEIDLKVNGLSGCTVTQRDGLITLEYPGGEKLSVSYRPDGSVEHYSVTTGTVVMVDNPSTKTVKEEIQAFVEQVKRELAPAVLSFAQPELFNHYDKDAFELGWNRGVINLNSPEIGATSITKEKVIDPGNPDEEGVMFSYAIPGFPADKKFNFTISFDKSNGKTLWFNWTAGDETDGVGSETDGSDIRTRIHGFLEKIKAQKATLVSTASGVDTEPVVPDWSPVVKSIDEAQKKITLSTGETIDFAITGLPVFKLGKGFLGPGEYNAFALHESVGNEGFKYGLQVEYDASGNITNCFVYEWKYNDHARDINDGKIESEEHITEKNPKAIFDKFLEFTRGKLAARTPVPHVDTAPHVADHADEAADHGSHGHEQPEPKKEKSPVIDLASSEIMEAFAPQLADVYLKSEEIMKLTAELIQLQLENSDEDGNIMDDVSGEARADLQNREQTISNLQSALRNEVKNLFEKSHQNDVAAGEKLHRKLDAQGYTLQEFSEHWRTQLSDTIFGMIQESVAANYARQTELNWRDRVNVSGSRYAKKIGALALVGIGTALLARLSSAKRLIQTIGGGVMGVLARRFLSTDPVESEPTEEETPTVDETRGNWLTRGAKKVFGVATKAANTLRTKVRDLGAEAEAKNLKERRALKREQFIAELEQVKENPKENRNNATVRSMASWISQAIRDTSFQESAELNDELNPDHDANVHRIRKDAAAALAKEYHGEDNEERKLARERALTDLTETLEQNYAESQADRLAEHEEKYKQNNGLLEGAAQLQSGLLWANDKKGWKRKLGFALAAGVGGLAAWSIGSGGDARSYIMAASVGTGMAVLGGQMDRQKKIEGFKEDLRKIYKKTEQQVQKMEETLLTAKAQADTKKLPENLTDLAKNVRELTAGLLNGVFSADMVLEIRDVIHRARAVYLLAGLELELEEGEIEVIAQTQLDRLTGEHIGWRKFVFGGLGAALGFVSGQSIDFWRDWIGSHTAHPEASGGKAMQQPEVAPRKTSAVAPVNDHSSNTGSHSTSGSHKVTPEVTPEAEPTPQKSTSDSVAPQPEAKEPTSEAVPSVEEIKSDSSSIQEVSAETAGDKTSNSTEGLLDRARTTKPVGLSPEIAKKWEDLTSSEDRYHDWEMKKLHEYGYVYEPGKGWTGHPFTVHEGAVQHIFYDPQADGGKGDFMATYEDHDITMNKGGVHFRNIETHPASAKPVLPEGHTEMPAGEKQAFADQYKNEIKSLAVKENPAVSDAANPEPEKFNIDPKQNRMLLNPDAVTAGAEIPKAPITGMEFLGGGKVAMDFEGQAHSITYEPVYDPKGMVKFMPVETVERVPVYDTATGKVIDTQSNASIASSAGSRGASIGLGSSRSSGVSGGGGTGGGVVRELKFWEDYKGRVQTPSTPESNGGGATTPRTETPIPDRALTSQTSAVENTVKGSSAGTKAVENVGGGNSAETATKAPGNSSPDSVAQKSNNTPVGEVAEQQAQEIGSSLNTAIKELGDLRKSIDEAISPNVINYATEESKAIYDQIMAKIDPALTAAQGGRLDSEIASVMRSGGHLDESWLVDKFNDPAVLLLLRGSGEGGLQVQGHALIFQSAGDQPVYWYDHLRNFRLENKTLIVEDLNDAGQVVNSNSFSVDSVHYDPKSGELLMGEPMAASK